ncbi:MAG: hypothetical protein HKN44_13370 [Ilumatobacter sp.]|nr:hypothetical protein [Ilumatobacter sp.]
MKTYPHGRNRFVVNKCRCDVCCEANRAYERDRRARVVPPYVFAQPARDHIAALAAAGVGLKQVAKASGVSHGSLSKLVYGTRNRGPSKRIRPDTMSKILAVTPADIADGGRVDAAPSWELIDEMVAVGVPKAQIAEQLGQQGPGLQLSRTSLSARNAAAVADLHRRWRTGAWVAERRTKHGNRPLPRPEPAATPVEVTPTRQATTSADISELLLELAEIVEERNAQPWRAQAACRNRPPWMWFPARGDLDTMRRALKVCRSCTVRAECRAANIDRPDGIFGALTAKARRDIRRQDVAS